MSPSVSDLVTAEMIGSHVDLEGKRSGRELQRSDWEAEGSASNSMYSVKLNKLS